MKKSLLFIILLIIWAPVLGQNEMTLKVGIKPEPPFVIKDANGEYSGLSVDLWKDIARQKNTTYEFIEYSDHLGLIRALDFGEIDVSVNPLHVSEVRLKLLDVTQPFFVSAIGVATSNAERNQITVFLSNFFSFQFLKIILLLVFIVLTFGTMLWIVERKHNQRQFRSNIWGLFDGLWWSAVTMTTVGYGDKAPKTKMGRTIAMIWMFSAIIIISGFTATIASTLTVKTLSRNIEDLDDIRNSDKVGSVYASSSEDYLRQNDVKIDVLYESVEKSLQALANHEIDVLVYDKTVLDYMINVLHMNQKVSLLPVNFNKQYRSFFLPKKSQHLSWINPILVKQINEPSWQQLQIKYNLQREQ